ncbi:MAG: hypothetical protein ACM31C_27280 [Acidobacteriota bacterium]
MNRRSFLLALGAAACGAKAPAKPRAPRKPLPPPPDGTVHEPEQDFALAEILRSPLGLHHELLVHATSSELRFWDAMTMTRVGSLELRTRGVCFLQDGTLAAFVQPPDQKRCELHLIDHNREVRVLWGPEFDGAIDSEIVPGRSAAEVYISDERYEITRFDLHERELRNSGKVAVDLSYWGRLRQLTSLGDGRLVTRGGTKLCVSEPGKRTLEYSTGKEIAVHLAPASRGRVWYSYFIGAPAAPQGIALVSLGDVLTVDARIDLAPAEINHAHADGGALAVLVHSEPSRWRIIVYDESGAERWRSDVPAPYAERGSRRRFGHVTISDQRVALLKAGSDTVLAWDATTGKPIG